MTDRPFEERLDEYLAFARQRPELFRSEPGGVQILLAPEDIRQVETDMATQLRRRGLPERGAEVGIISPDPYIWMLRDAVEFPDGARRLHTRVINRISDGAAVLPLFDGRICLTRQFRHALRRWSLEVPRGAMEPGETPDVAAAAEVREEIGGEIGELVSLGFMHGSTNLYANGVHMFFARLTCIGAPQIAEAISSIEQIAISDFERMIVDSVITDGVTVAAFAHARLRGLI